MDDDQRISLIKFRANFYYGTAIDKDYRTEEWQQFEFEFIGYDGQLVAKIDNNIPKPDPEIISSMRSVEEFQELNENELIDGLKMEIGENDNIISV